MVFPELAFFNVSGVRPSLALGLEKNVKPKDLLSLHFNFQ